MSGCSYPTECPSCGEEASGYSDHKPFEIANTECPHCGFYATTQTGFMDLEGLNELRELLEMPTLAELPKQECDF